LLVSLIHFIKLFFKKIEKLKNTNIYFFFSGKTFGVAKLSNVIAVKVLDKSGIGTSSSVIAGLLYVLNEHMKDKNKNTIIKYVILL
jgi:hypothetical protein